jgi:hypothetical protein
MINWPFRFRIAIDIQRIKGIMSGDPKINIRTTRKGKRDANNPATFLFKILKSIFEYTGKQTIFLFKSHISLDCFQCRN